ncbi:succinate dehydrogenase [Janibacter sp. Soil728]|uniref:succinate dehydrogenase cytochrome b subunit n=1 Tax=Janibacter sp. Soil728 TaxID=1736393 RepID=UPI0006F43C67|nr:succinate dehydrogenase cytochrome b subunit [Janibacter sp. Soil728]KRE37470.1 succinate dehydrogenase [Janibacter sp. Soil728]
MATTTLPAKKKGVASSSIGLKFLMAGTGVIFILYVLLHMYGNLKALAGQEAFDTYAHHLRTFGEPMLPYGGLLWVVRIVLILALVGHVYAALRLIARNNAARPVKYQVKKNVGSTLASRTMRWGGLALFAFIIFHLIQFTIVKPNLYGAADSEAIKESPYVMISAAFAMWWVLLIYVIALVALGMHLYHGIYSASQTMGLNNTATARARARAIGAVVAAVIVVGFLIPPVYIFIDSL